MHSAPLRSSIAGLLLALAVFGPPAPARASGMDTHIFTLLEADQLEHRFRDGNDLVAWDVMARAGTDEHKLALKSEGEYERGANKFERAELQLVYQRMISDFFDAQVGVRHDFKPSPSRTYAVLGLSGLAPQWLETDANFFFSENGTPSFRIGAEHDLLITQRLIFQSSAEVNFQVAGDRAIRLGSGFSSIELGGRLRYEIAREVAPYVGVNWERKFGRTAGFAKDAGEAIDSLSFVTGLRLSF